VFSTCDNSGRHGPTQHQCDLVYQGHHDIDVKVKVVDDSGTLGLPAGTQLWIVPVDGFYTYVLDVAITSHNTRTAQASAQKKPVQIPSPYLESRFQHRIRFTSKI